MFQVDLIISILFMTRMTLLERLTNANSLNSLLSYALANLSSQLTSPASSSSRMNLFHQHDPCIDISQTRTYGSPSIRRNLSDLEFLAFYLF